MAALTVWAVEAQAQHAASAPQATTADGFSNLTVIARAALATNPPSKIRHGLEALTWLSSHALATTDETERMACARQISEITAAIENNSRSPVPRQIDVLQLPFVHYRYISGRVGLGTIPAVNLRPGTNEARSSERQPTASTFWSAPINIAAQDLNSGFGRTERPAFEGILWTYAEAKTGFGAHPGFEVQNGKHRLKIKFGELQSEPFTARIFHALGYHVDATDYSPSLKVKYDRRIFTEFNSRKPVDTKISMMGVLPVWTIHFQPAHDPFNFLAGAVLGDGRTLTPPQLRQALSRHTIDTDLESRIAYLITAPANVQLKNPDEKNIGPWDFGQLQHEDLRELRGAGLLAAWVGWFDSRFDNTRLRVVKRGDAFKLKHVFSDVGGGLGKSVGWSGWRGEAPDEFPDSFTEPEVFQGKGKMTKPFRVVNFRPIEPTPAFQEMTIDDARWMARLMAQLTERQIKDALRASGFDETNVQLYLRKLVTRREKMLRDLKVEAVR